MKDRIAGKIKENKADLLYCLAVGFLWGLVSYGFIFLSSGFGHDAMVEFNSASYGNNLKIQAGRVFVPAYRFITRTALTIPWMIGLFRLLWFSLALFFLTKLLGLHSRYSVALAGGLLITNPAICALAATYIHDMDSNALALLCAVLAVYLWARSPKGFLAGMVCVCLALGIYQSYLSIVITLIVYVCLLHILDGEGWQKVLLMGGKGIGMILGGGMLYLPALKIIPAVTGIPIATNGYNTLDKMTRLDSKNIAEYASNAYRTAIHEMVQLPSGYPQKVIRLLVGCSLFLLAVIMLLGLLRKKVTVVGKIMAVVLLAVLPLGMNLTHVLTLGVSHDLM